MTKATRVGCSNVLKCDAPIISSKPQETLPIQSSDTCALAAATRSNQGSGGTRLHNETQTIKNRKVWTSGIAEVDLADKLPRACCQVNCRNVMRCYALLGYVALFDLTRSCSILRVLTLSTCQQLND